MYDGFNFLATYTVYIPDGNPADTWTKIYNQIVTCRVEGMLGIIGKVKIINEIK